MLPSFVRAPPGLTASLCLPLRRVRGVQSASPGRGFPITHDAGASTVQDDAAQDSTVWDGPAPEDAWQDALADSPLAECGAATAPFAGDAGFFPVTGSVSRARGLRARIARQRRRRPRRHAEWVHRLCHVAAEHYVHQRHDDDEATTLRVRMPCPAATTSHSTNRQQQGDHHQARVPARRSGRPELCLLDLEHRALSGAHARPVTEMPTTPRRNGHEAPERGSRPSGLRIARRGAPTRSAGGNLPIWLRRPSQELS